MAEMICPKAKECKLEGCYHFKDKHKEDNSCHDFTRCGISPACVPYEPEKINIDSIEARKLMAKTVEDFEKANKPEYTLALIPNDIIVEVRYPHNATCYDCQHKFKVINPEKLAEAIYDLIAPHIDIEEVVQVDIKIKQAISEYMEAQHESK